SPGAPAAFPAPLAVRAARDDPAHRDPRRLLSARRGSRLTRDLPAVLRAARRRGPSGRVEAPPSLLEHLLVARSRGVAHAGRVPTPATGDSVRAAGGRAPAPPPPHAPHRRRRRPPLAPASRPRPVASPLASGPEDTALATPERRLAADGEAVEADFERSGCPRP